MSPTVALIVFIAAIVVTVILGNKFKCNIGIIGICFAFIIGTIFMKLTIAQVIGFFPASLLFQMMIVTFFGNRNGKCLTCWASNFSSSALNA